MNCQEKWNILVKDYRKLFNDQEAKVQLQWETYCSELFGYKKLLGEIDSQRSMHIGSSDRIIPDIILRKDERDIFDIELKKYCLAFDPCFEKQLISYMKMLRLSIGMIVCKTILLFSYDYARDTIERVEIAFTENNADGIKLIELLGHDSFSENEIKSFIEQKMKYDRDVESILMQLTSEYIKELVVNDLKSTHSEEEVNGFLGKISFHVAEKTTSFPLSWYSTPSEPSTPQITQEYIKKLVIYNLKNTYSEDEIEKALNKKSIFVSKSFAQINPPFQPSKPPSVPLPDTNQKRFSVMIKKWCIESASKGLLQFDPQKSIDSCIRFTTEFMDRLLPLQTDYSSHLWKGRSYYYEIVNESNRIKMRLTLKNNHDANLQAIYKILQFSGSFPQSEYWEWELLWATKPANYKMLTSEAAVFELLNQQFGTIMENEKNLSLSLEN